MKNFSFKSLGAFQAVKGSTHVIPKTHKRIKATPGSEVIMVTLIVRRRTDGTKLRDIKDFTVKVNAVRPPIDRKRFAEQHGASPADIEAVMEFSRIAGLNILETNVSARSVVLSGSAKDVNKAFGVMLVDYQGLLGRYHSHIGPARLPRSLAKIVEQVIGLHSCPIHARAHNTLKNTSKDPANTKPVSPGEIAKLYNFPSGNGAGQTIGIYEMATEDPESGQLAYAGYTDTDVANTIKGFGGGLRVPTIIDVPIDGRKNSGINDGETLLDITVAGAIAQGATIAVYFAGAQTQNMIHALQKMIHPGTSDPKPTVISISYGWGPDNNQSGFSTGEFEQFGKLFQDAANLYITVLISSGDSGCYLGTEGVAQASYPATEPMVIACGGTTVGNIEGSTFDEYAWNDVGAGGPGASGGGISTRFAVPTYQSGVSTPKNLSTKQAGRGIPDVAANASENSGYMQNAAGSPPQPVGGTSAVAPLYAGLFAVMNSNLGVSVGFVNPVLYKSGSKAFRDISGPPGPANNSFNGTTGYPVSVGWDAVTGLGSVNGTALQAGLKAANAGSKMPV